MKLYLQINFLKPMVFVQPYFVQLYFVQLVCLVLGLAVVAVVDVVVVVVVAAAVGVVDSVVPVNRIEFINQPWAISNYK